MRRSLLVAVLLVLASGCAGTGLAGVGAEDPTGSCADAPATGAYSSTASTRPVITEVLPNPVADGDAGEFVTVRVPPGPDSTANLTLADGEDVVPVAEPPGDDGTVTVAAAPDAVPGPRRRRATNATGALALSNAVETIRLRDGSTVLDCVAYEDAPEGAVLAQDGPWPADDPGPDAPGNAPQRGWDWRPVGATDFDVVTAGPGTVRAFLLPDAPAVPIDTLRAADRRILLAAYTLTSRRVERALLAAHRRGVDVRVLVERSPVGGMVEGEARILDNLSAAGVEVVAPGGPRRRYAVHHEKYAVVDDSALVTTENWSPAGTGGRSSRGWGAVTGQDAVVERLAALFRADATWESATPWPAVRESVDPVPGNRSRGRYPTRRDPVRVRAEATSVLVGPDNAAAALRDRLRRANESVDVLQMDGGDPGQPFVRALVDAARRGVQVRVLLGSAWYVEDENRDVVEHLQAVAANESLPLEAHLADPGGRFGKVHAKGVVIDGDTVVLGSLNWNNHSARENREVALVLEGDAVGEYFAAAFRADWRGTPWRVPIGVVLIGVVVVAVALLRAAAVRVDDQTGFGQPTAQARRDPPGNSFVGSPGSPGPHDGGTTATSDGTGGALPTSRPGRQRHSRGPRRYRRRPSSRRGRR